MFLKCNIFVEVFKNKLRKPLGILSQKTKLEMKDVSAKNPSIYLNQST